MKSELNFWHWYFCRQCDVLSCDVITWHKGKARSSVGRFRKKGNHRKEKVTHLDFFEKYIFFYLNHHFHISQSFSFKFCRRMLHKTNLLLCKFQFLAGVGCRNIMKMEGSTFFETICTSLKFDLKIDVCHISFSKQTLKS